MEIPSPNPLSYPLLTQWRRSARCVPAQHCGGRAATQPRAARAVHPPGAAGGGGPVGSLPEPDPAGPGPDPGGSDRLALLLSFFDILYKIPMDRNFYVCGES